MIEYKEIDMYDTEIKTYGKKHGDHIFTLRKNSKGIMIVKCENCDTARLFLMGHDITHCKIKKELKNNAL